MIEQPKPLSFAANVNAARPRRAASSLLVANPDTVAEPDAVAVLRDFVGRPPALRRRRPAAARPRRRAGSRRAAASRRSAARSSAARRSAAPSRRSSASATTTSSTSGRPSRSQADWMLGGFLLIRRATFDELGGFDAGFRMYGEEIDFCYRLAKAGWERWYVPAGGRRATAGTRSPTSGS